jgi:hypothetical protein
MRAFIEDQLAQRRSGRPDRGSILADALNGPSGVAPMGRSNIRRLREGGSPLRPKLTPRFRGVADMAGLAGRPIRSRTRTFAPELTVPLPCLPYFLN